jgi:hypothetical protein
MIAHVVLYELRPDLTPAERTRFAATLRQAVAAIPTIRRIRIGRRRRIGVSYEAAAPASYEFIGILEFDDEAGLKQYLEHAAHAALGQLFWEFSARALVFDYELTDDLEVVSSWVRRSPDRS